MQSFMHKALGMSLAQVMRYNCGALLVAIAGSFVAGFIADKHQTRAPLILSLLAMVLLQYPMMVLLHQNQGYGPVVAQWVYGALAGAYCGALFPCLVELFPTAVRFTGVNFSMSLCSSLFGGTVPMVAFALVKRYSTPLGLFLFAGYTTVFCTISFCALWVFNQKRPLRATKAQPAQSCMQAAQGILQANAAAGTQDKNVLDPHTPAVL
jgi:MFS family permease